MKLTFVSFFFLVLSVISFTGVEYFTGNNCDPEITSKYPYTEITEQDWVHMTISTCTIMLCILYHNILSKVERYRVFHTLTLIFPIFLLYVQFSVASNMIMGLRDIAVSTLYCCNELHSCSTPFINFSIFSLTALLFSQMILLGDIIIKMEAI